MGTQATATPARRQRFRWRLSAGRERHLPQRAAREQAHAALRVAHPTPRRRGEQAARGEVGHPPLPGHGRPLGEAIAHHQVGAGGRGEQARYGVGRVLPVGVQHEHSCGGRGLAAQAIEPRPDRRALATVAAEPEQLGPRRGGPPLEEASEGRRRPVVDDEHPPDEGSDRVEEAALGRLTMGRDQGDHVRGRQRRRGRGRPCGGVCGQDRRQARDRIGERVTARTALGEGLLAS